MKYGENITRISVPKWNIHNVDYNSLKTCIKLNTRRDEAKAKAIAIPGQPDTARSQFEEQLFQHLCHEHRRVNLFVGTKTQELSRRLRHLSDQIHRLALRCNQSSRTSSKRYSKLLRYEQDLLRIGDDINNLPRFVHAQAEAFRKILKKHRKWTGSTTLGDRFKFECLDDPKSFAHVDLTNLAAQFDSLAHDIQSLTPHISTHTTPVHNSRPTTSRRPSTATNNRPELPRQDSSNPQRYWNEYEDGSEAGDITYEIYCVADDEDFFPAWATRPFATIRLWFSRKRPHPDEEQARTPLLNAETSSLSYAGTATPPSRGDSDDDDEDNEGSTSADEFPGGYETHFASLPSITEQRMEWYKNNALSYATLGLFTVSSILLIVAEILVSTGRHKLMSEVDLGVTIGVATSLACSFIGIAMFLLRTDKGGSVETTIVSLWFVIVCGGSGVLLVQVADRVT